MAPSDTDAKPLPHFKAIAAMARNRVIGCRNTIPWRLPEDFAWFKRCTMGGILVMGRKTFDSIGRPLPGRETWVLSRSTTPIPGVRVVNAIEDILALPADRTVWIAGGADIYRQLLPHCSELFLSRVDAEPEGDAFFPPFEHRFAPGEPVLEKPGFTVWKYRRPGA